jgi:hypothetical protein
MLQRKTISAALPAFEFSHLPARENGDGEMPFAVLLYA